MGTRDIRGIVGRTLQGESNNRNDSIQPLVRRVGGGIGLLAAIFVILADYGAPPQFDGIGKAIFWTGMVLVPLVAFNRDVLHFASSFMTITVLFAMQALLVIYGFSELQHVNFLILAPICLIQVLIFSAPLMLIRKHRTGIWY